MTDSLPATIPENVLRAATTYPDNTFFNYIRNDWQSLAYRDFLGQVQALAAYLIGSGLARSERIAIVSENRYEWCSAYMAVIFAGGIAVPLDVQLGPHEIANLLADSGSRAVFFSEKTAANVLLALQQLPEKARQSVGLINFDSPGYSALLGTKHVTELPVPDPDDTASVIYTSGTTGSPKGVMLSHRNFCSDAEAIIRARIVSHEDNILAVLPLHHTYAFMCTFLAPCFIGASITYPASLKGPDLMAALKEKQVSVIVGVPQLLGIIRNGIINKIAGLPGPFSFILLQMLRLSGGLRSRYDINIGRILFKSVHAAFGVKFRFFASGGARLDPAIMKDLEALGFTVLEGYGLTETSPVVAFNPAEKRKPGSAGKPFPSAAVRIVDPDQNGEGEIAIQGPMVMKGYYRKPSVTAEAVRDGWFMTGDIGRIDSDGYLFITGRLKEVIVLSSGKNIYPEEVEALYQKSRLIKELCVTGIEEKGIIESLHAVIVPDVEYARKAGITNIQESLKWEISEISSSMPSYMRIKGYSLQKEPLPRTPLGKLRRFLIRGGPAAERRAEGAGEDAGFSGDETAAAVKEILEQFVKGDRRITLPDNLELDLGLDSLSKIELMAALERSFGIKLPDDFMTGVQTVHDLAEKVRTLVKQGEGAGPSGKAAWAEILRQEIPEKDRLTISLENPEDRMIPSRLIYAALRGLCRIFFRLEAEGVEHIPTSRNFIITPNHTSYLDGFVVILAIPFSFFKQIYVLGLREFFTGSIRSSLARLAHVIPIDSASYLSKALQMSAFVLGKGRSLCVFPEGGRSFDGDLMEFKKGVGILALEMGIPVVPAYIDGPIQVLPKGARLPRLGRITVRYGAPLSAKDVDFSRKPEGMDDYQYFASVLQERVRGLKP